MEYKDIAQWSNAADEAVNAPIGQNLPDLLMVPMGGLYKEELPLGIRLWQKVDIISGNIGGRWAYWKAWQKDGRSGLGPHPLFQAIADLIFNGDVPHFIGMLATPYDKIPRPMWVLIEPRLNPPRPVWVPEDRPNPRYEKSKEVFDVDTQESHEL